MYSSVCVAQSAGEQETFFLLSLRERGMRVLNLYLCFRVQAVNFVLSFSSVNGSVAVMLRGSSVEQYNEGEQDSQKKQLRKFIS
jgi:hypothetical protein